LATSYTSAWQILAILPRSTRRSRRTTSTLRLNTCLQALWARSVLQVQSHFNEACLTCQQVISPNSQTSYSAHEGQVLIGATYPTNRDVNRKEFEESLRALLAVEGPLCAWQKLSATEVGTFQMVAEFFDASLAPRAVQRCNQLKNGVSLRSINPGPNNG
jgi:hypothetical protein